MFCKHCGKEITEETKFCPFCGAAQSEANNTQSGQTYQAQNNQYQQPYVPQTQDAPSGGFAFLCFLFPIIGLILYLVWKDTLPLRAKSCGKGAIVGVIVEVVFFIISIVLSIVAAGAAGGSMYY